MRRGPALALLVTAALVGPRTHAEEPPAARYLPLHTGNWWAYEERDECGKRLSRETWTIDGRDTHRADELHLRASTKRLDAVGDMRRRWEAHEYLRVTPDGVRKRYPVADGTEMDVTLVKEPARAGTRWRDAQGRCEVVEQGGPCRGPRGPLADCLVVICRLGEPAATIVTSTYARGIGMVRQEIEVVQLGPTFGGGPHEAMVAPEGLRGARSLLELVGWHVEVEPTHPR